MTSRWCASPKLPTALLLIGALLVARVDANSGGGGGGGGNNPFRPNNNNEASSSECSSPDNNDDGRPRYSLSQQLSFDLTDEKLSVAAETESMAFYESDDNEETKQLLPEEGKRQRKEEEQQQQQPEEEALGVVDEVLQADAHASAHASSSEAVFTSDAFLCGRGGDQPFVAMAECRFVSEESMDVDSDDEDSDDDDDDDDGHSSMLSNASFRRSLASANGASSSGATGPPYKNKSSGSRRSTSGYSGPSYFGGGSARSVPISPRRGGVRFLSALPETFRRSSTRTTSRSSSSSSSSSLNSALSVRGGASSDPNELARRLLVAALVTIIYEAVLGHLLEFVKIVMQTSPHGTTYRDVMHTITGTKGITGIWDGFVPWGVAQSIMKGGVFGLAHALASGYLIPLAEKENSKLPMLLAMTLSGAIGGFFQGFVLSPLLLLKTRVMTNDAFREKMSLIRTTYLSLTIGFDVVKHEGVLALMKGSNIFATKRLFDWATRFFFSDMVEAILVKYSTTGSLTPGEKVAASLMGGTLSTISTLPLDVLVAKSQDAKKAGVPVSAWTMFKQELDEKGWKGLGDSYMNGFEARLAHVCLTTVVMKTGAPILYDFLYRK